MCSVCSGYLSQDTEYFDRPAFGGSMPAQNYIHKAPKMINLKALTREIRNMGQLPPCTKYAFPSSPQLAQKSTALLTHSTHASIHATGCQMIFDRSGLAAQFWF